MKFDQDLCLNLQSDFGKMNSTLGSVVPLAMFLSYPRTPCICSQLFPPPGEGNVLFALCPSLIEGVVAKKARIQPAPVSFSDIQLPGPKAKRFVAGGPASWCQYLVNVYRQQVADPASQAALHHHQIAPDKNKKKYKCKYSSLPSKASD